MLLKGCVEQKKKGQFPKKTKGGERKSSLSISLVPYQTQRREDEGWMMVHDGYETDEDAELACATVVGSIDIAEGGVLVEHRHPSDTVEDAFWSRSYQSIMGHVGAADASPLTNVQEERLYDLLCSATMQRDVRWILEAGDAPRELRGTGLTYGMGCDVYVSEEGYPTGELHFALWVRAHARLRSRPLSPSPPPPLSDS